MIKRVNEKFTKDQVLGFLDPVIKEWFNNNFEDLTAAQAHAIPIINKGKNVLVASPTGSGKTLTAFLMIINELFELGKKNELENKVYCIYISPLKALANDIERNLNLPLQQIYDLATKHNITLPEIRVGVRSGDTSTADRQKMVKKAPHILITTPESLSIIISTKRFRFKLSDARFVIVDEIHEICNSKRGVHLSLSLERLQHQVLNSGVGREFIRIGLSATQAPIKEIAKFLVGYNKNQKLRNINIVEVPAGKKLDLKIVCPVKDMNLIPFEIINAKMYNILNNLINSHRTTLIFTNTRSGAETVAYKLHEQGLEDIAAHHGSLSKETRLDVENKLKNGDLAATICSTSLELGIDIGYIDLVCQIGSPKSIAKGLQRIGRAGHALHEVSKGRILVFDRDDLVECAVLVKNAYKGNIDRINILKNSLDVLAQSLIGMSLEQPWELADAFSLVKQSYCYHNLRKRDFLSVLNYIGGKHTMEDRGVYGKVRYYPDEKRFGIRRGGRLIYNLNIGTIPQEANFKVVILGTGYVQGVLSERFVERLVSSDVFVLGGKTFEFIQTKGMKVYVRDAHGRKPTVPSWTGEMLPRSFDLSNEIGKFRAELEKKLYDMQVSNVQYPLEKPALSQKDYERVEKWLKDGYYLDSGSARSIINYFIEQQGIIGKLPSNKNLLIEGYIDGRGYKNIIFHFCFGRRVNDALARAYAYAISKELNCTVKISLTDDNFMLTLPKHMKLSGIETLVTKETLVENLRAAIRNTELFKQRFRHCAVRSFMILRNYKGKEISIRKQLKRSHRILDVLENLRSFPIIDESYNEILHSAMDITHAEEVLDKIGSGEFSITYSNYSKVPSPFAHNVVLIGISDIILMEDRSALLRELHQQVLSRVFTSLEISKPKFELDLVQKHFKAKFPMVKSKSDIYSLLKLVGPLQLFKDKGKNIFSHTGLSHNIIHHWSLELISEKKIISIIRNNDVYWLLDEHLKYYLKLYADHNDLSIPESHVLNWVAAGRSSGRLIPGRLSPKFASVQQNGTGDSLSNEKSSVFEFLNELKISINDLREILKKLEKRFLIHRLEEKKDGSIRWFVVTDGGAKNNDAKDDEAAGTSSVGNTVDYKSALDFIIKQYLEYYAPSPVSEIAYDLGLEEDLTARILSDLVDAGHVVSGNYIWGKDVPQFMLLLDEAELSQPAVENLRERYVKLEFVKDYRLNKLFEQMNSIEDYFNKYKIAFSLREIYLRTKGFEITKWNDFLTSSDLHLVYGRFLNGRLCYIPEEDLPLYVSAYREAPVTQQELTIWNKIRTHSGITRKELSDQLDARQSDLKDIIDKLERNLYLYREPPKYDSRVGVNKYIAVELENMNKALDGKYEIIRRLIKIYSPISEEDLNNYTGFPRNYISKSLNELVSTGEITSFKVLGETQVEMYIPTKEFMLLKEFGDKDSNKGSNNLKILSQSDSYALRERRMFRLKFGEGWQAPVIYYGELIGAVDLWRLGDCVEIRDILLDDGLVQDLIRAQPRIKRDLSIELADRPSRNWKLNILAKILTELDRVMDYYKMYNIDIIRIRTIFGTGVESLPEDIEHVLTEAGFNKVQDFYVKGKLAFQVFEEKQIMRLVLQNQHVLLEYRFTNPLDVFRTLGGLRSNFEVRLRLDGEFYDIKEFRKNLNLAAGPIIPEHYAYCTEKDLKIYRVAKGRELDFNMEYILENMPDDLPISSHNLFARLTLPREQYNSARKRLYSGLFITRNPTNKYVKVPRFRNLTTDYARKYVVKRIIKNFGIFSVEGLAAFLKNEYSRNELRKILLELEAEGVIIKGYFIENDDTLYWLYSDHLKELKNEKIINSDYIIVSPTDQLAAYLAPITKARLRCSGCYIIIHYYEIAGAFKIKVKKKGRAVKVFDFIGDDAAWKAVERFFRQNKLDIIDEAAEELYTDYDE